MTKYRLDCYTELQYKGEQPAFVLWFDTEKAAIQEGADWAEYVHGIPASAWFSVTEEREIVTNGSNSPLENKKYPERERR